jgi:hypothetical protein
LAIGDALPELVGEIEPVSRDMILARLYSSDSRSFASFEGFLVGGVLHIV